MRKQLALAACLSICLLFTHNSVIAIPDGYSMLSPSQSPLQILSPQYSSTKIDQQSFSEKSYIRSRRDLQKKSFPKQNNKEDKNQDKKKDGCGDKCNKRTSLFSTFIKDGKFVSSNTINSSDLNNTIVF